MTSPTLLWHICADGVREVHATSTRADRMRWDVTPVTAGPTTSVPYDVLARTEAGAMRAWQDRQR